MARIAPYGSWASPISAEIAAQAAISFSGLEWDGADLYWVENRPRDGGRGVVVRRTGRGQILELTSAAHSVRSTVHEYGGGALAVHNGSTFYVNYADQRIYRQHGPAAPVALTPETRCRYADLKIDLRRQELLCVEEDHSSAGEASNTIASIPLEGGAARILLSGSDFYSDPCPSPDGKQLAYLTWNHPNMPWDGCELHLAEFGADGSLHADQRLAGGPDELIFQPEWSPWRHAALRVG